MYVRQRETIMLQTHGKREARSVKRFSIGIHVSLGIARETTRDEAIFPNFDDLQQLSVVHKAKPIVTIIVMSLSCAQKFL